MKVHFRRRAAEDLREIREYYLRLDADALANVLDDIERTLRFIADYPSAGSPISGRGFRTRVTRRYRYTIAYFPQDGTVSILGIFRYQNRLY